MTMTDEYEVLSRLLDGEPVDEDKLRDALGRPGAVDLLLEWANLRHALRADLGQPDDEFCDRMRRRLRTPGWRRLLQERLVPVGVAAGLLAGAFLGYGVRWWAEPVVPAQVRLAAEQQAATPSEPTTVVVPSEPLTEAGPAEKPRAAIPGPEVRVPFAEWRDSTLPN
jgi:hypothetical protein